MRHALLSLFVVCGVVATSGCHNPVTDALHRVEHKVLYHPAPYSTDASPSESSDVEDVSIALEEELKLYDRRLAQK